MEFSTPRTGLTIEADRTKLLMSEALRGRVPGLEDLALNDSEITGDSAVVHDQLKISDVDDAFAPVTLVIERSGKGSSPEHLIGTLVSAIKDVENKELTIAVRLPLEEAWIALSDAASDNSLESRYDAVQAHRGENDPVIRIETGPLNLASVQIADVTSANTCTLTLRFRTSVSDT